MDGTEFYVNNNGHVLWKDCGSKVTAAQERVMDPEMKARYGKLCLSTLPQREEENHYNHY